MSKVRVLKEEIFTVIVIALLLPILMVAASYMQSNNMGGMENLVASGNSTDSLIIEENGEEYKGDLILDFPSNDDIKELIDWDDIYGSWNSVDGIASYLSNSDQLYIQNAEQLKVFAKYVNEGNSCSGKEIILMGDIGVTDYIPIGTLDNRFKGTFNGNGFGIILKEVYSGDLENYGIFGVIGKGGVVKNLKIKEASVDLSESGVSAAGIVAGQNFGRISKCSIETSTIIGGKGVHSTFGTVGTGGIVGSNRGIVEQCKVINCKVKGHGCLGGIAGVCHTDCPSQNSSGYEQGDTGQGWKIDSCYVNYPFDQLEMRDETDLNHVGGIVGYAYGDGKIEGGYFEELINNCLVDDIYIGRL